MRESVNKSGGLRLRAWRQRERLSLHEVGALTGFTPQMLSFVENGKRQLSRRGKILVARRLGVPLGELFEVEAVADAEALV